MFNKTAVDTSVNVHARVLKYATDKFMTLEMFRKSVIKETYLFEYVGDQLMTKSMIVLWYFLIIANTK